MIGFEQHPMMILMLVRNLPQPDVDCGDDVDLDGDDGGGGGDGCDGGGGDGGGNDHSGDDDDDGGDDGGGGDDDDGGGDVGGDDIVHQGLVPANLTTSGSWVQPGEMLGIELAAGQEGRSSCFDFCICVIV